MPINRAARGGAARRRIPAERHTSIVTQRDGAGPVPINRAASGIGRAGCILNIRKTHPFIVLVIHRARLPGCNRHRLLHILVMEHELEGDIIQHQGTISPEPGAGAVGIEVVGNGVIRGIQRDGVTLSIHQTGNTSGQGVGLAITLAAIKKLQNSIAIQRKCATFQVGNGIRSRIIDDQRILATQREVSSMGCRRTSEAKSKTGE